MHVAFITIVKRSYNTPPSSLRRLGGGRHPEYDHIYILNAAVCHIPVYVKFLSEWVYLVQLIALTRDFTHRYLIRWTGEALNGAGIKERVQGWERVLGSKPTCFRLICIDTSHRCMYRLLLLGLVFWLIALYSHEVSRLYTLVPIIATILHDDLTIATMAGAPFVLTAIAGSQHKIIVRSRANWSVVSGFNLGYFNDLLLHGAYLILFNDYWFRNLIGVDFAVRNGVHLSLLYCSFPSDVFYRLSPSTTFPNFSLPTQPYRTM